MTGIYNTCIIMYCIVHITLCIMYTSSCIVCTCTSCIVCTCMYYYIWYLGFIYTGTFYHDQVHLTQFIAPLQADFNPTLGDDSRILIYSSGITICTVHIYNMTDIYLCMLEDRFTAQWDQVHNHDHEDGNYIYMFSLYTVLVSLVRGPFHISSIFISEWFYLLCIQRGT